VRNVKRALRSLVEGTVAPLAPFVWRAQPAPRLLILMYHRVLPREHPDRASEQPGMYVSPETLATHIRLLRRYFEIVHLDEWVQRAANGQPLPRLGCALTFDDGWRDNFEYAFPILRAEAVPATIYLLSDLMGTQYRLWPNRLARLLADALSNEVYVSWPDWLRREIAAATVARAVPLPLSAAQIDVVITRCKELESDEAMLGILDAIERAAGRHTYTERDLLDWDEVRQMAASGLIRFGSHTRRHIRLDAHTKPEVLRQEICESRTTIERQLGTPVRSFCYPNGDHCPAAVDLVRRCYSAAVTTQRAWNTRTSNRHLLSRVGVHEDVSCTPRAFLARLALA